MRKVSVRLMSVVLVGVVVTVGAGVAIAGTLERVAVGAAGVRRGERRHQPTGELVSEPTGRTAVRAAAVPGPE